MATSRFSDELVPSLSEKDARTISEQVTGCLRVLGALPSQIGVHLDKDGFWFAATINGKFATARFGQGNFAYATVARDLLLAARDPNWNKVTVKKS